MWFKEDDSDEHAFRKTHVRLKNELVHGDLENVSVENGGKRLSPEGLHQLYKEKKDFVIVDARNWYESKIGKFKNAITPPMKNFREWKKVVDEDLIEYKNKTVVTYCTGGIRCEKASAYMVERGFNLTFTNLMVALSTSLKNFQILTGRVECSFLTREELLIQISKEELKHIARAYRP